MSGTPERIDYPHAKVKIYPPKKCGAQAAEV